MKSLVTKMLIAVAAICFSIGAFAGANNGSIQHADGVAARDTDTYHIAFEGDELARIAVIGDGSTNLCLYVYDRDGNLIGSDTDFDDDKLVEFTPRWTGPFTVKIVNRGWEENDYVLLTN